MTDSVPLNVITSEHQLTHGVRMDLNKLIETRLLIQANSGGGKSYAIRWLLEQTYGKVQHIVIDREGEFSTLRGIHPYLLVGRDGDVAADIGTAKLLARKVLELGLSTIVDLSEMSPGQQRAYVRVFVDSLNHAPRALWKDCLIVIDEAHIFAPESGKGASEATESIALLLSTGRKRGFCPVLATQRLAKLNKDVAAECLNKLIGRTSNEDLKRAAEELAQGKQSSIQLRGLDPGTFWAYGPAIAPEPVLVRTGKVRTAPPARGAERSTPPDAPEEIRAALAKELAELPKQAADEAQSVEALTQQVRGLMHENKRLKSAQPEPQVVRVRDDAELQEMRRYVEGIQRHQRAMLEGMQRTIEAAHEHISQARDVVIGELQAEPPRPMPMSVEPPEQRGHGLHATVRRPTRDVELLPTPRTNGELPRGALKMLEVLSYHETQPLTPAQLGTLAGYSAAGGTFGEYLRQLRRAGLVETDITRGGIILSESGQRKVGGFKPKPPPGAVFQRWCNALPLGPRRMLEVLQKWPSGLSLARLGDESGYASSGGTFGEYLRQLKRNGLVTVEHGYAKLVAELFQ